MVRSYFIILIFLLDFQTGVAQQLENLILTENQFNGYTNHWQDTYHHWLRYGNLFKMAVSDVEKTIMQSKVDVAEDLGIPGLVMQEGFIDGLISDQFIVLDQPSVEDLESNLKNNNLFYRGFSC